jgi:hypothetical protein
MQVQHCYQVVDGTSSFTSFSTCTARLNTSRQSPKLLGNVWLGGSRQRFNEDSCLVVQQPLSKFHVARGKVRWGCQVNELQEASAKVRVGWTLNWIAVQAAGEEDVDATVDTGGPRLADVAVGRLQEGAQ